MDPTVKYITNSLLQYMSSSQNIGRSLIDKARKFVESRFEEPIKNTADEPAVITIREIVIEFFSEVYAKQLREELDRTIMQGDVPEPSIDRWSAAIAEQVPCAESSPSSVLEVGNMARQYQKELIEQGAYKTFITNDKEIQTITEQFDKYFVSWESYRPNVSPEQYKEAIFLNTVAHIKGWGDHVNVLLQGGHIRMRELSTYHVYLYIYLFMAYQSMPQKLIDKLRHDLTNTAEGVYEYLHGKIKQEGKANGTYDIKYLKLNIFKWITTAYNTCYNTCIPGDWVTLNIEELSL